MILEHGAEFGNALARAAEYGYKDVVHALLDHGGTIELSSSNFLQHAIKLEHTELFHLLCQRGAGPISNGDSCRVSETRRGQRP